MEMVSRTSAADEIAHFVSGVKDMADSIDILIARFIHNSSKYATLQSGENRLILKREKSRSGEPPAYQLTGIVLVPEKKGDIWSGGATSTTIGFFETKEELAEWIKTEEGVDKVKASFNLLHRVADKEPYEDWDW